MHAVRCVHHIHARQCMHRTCTYDTYARRSRRHTHAQGLMWFEAAHTLKYTHVHTNPVHKYTLVLPDNEWPDQIYESTKYKYISVHIEERIRYLKSKSWKTRPTGGLQLSRNRNRRLAPSLLILCFCRVCGPRVRAGVFLCVDEVYVCMYVCMYVYEDKLAT